MAEFPLVLEAAYPLNLSDDNRLIFSDSLNGQILSRNLSGVPDDFGYMTSLNFRLEYRRVDAGPPDDTLYVQIRVRNGAGILAANDAYGTFYYVANVTNDTDITTAVIPFPFVNSSAGAESWNDAEVQIQQLYFDVHHQVAHIEVDWVELTGVYEERILETFVVQDDTGLVLNATSYISVEDCKHYLDARGQDYSAYTDEELEDALVRATDYIDTRFMFVGEKKGGRAQNTQWPRTGAWDRDRCYVTDVPIEVKEATCEYALRAAAADINPDPTRDETGGIVQSKREKVGPIETSVAYTKGACFRMPRYPAADYKLLRSGLVIQGGIVQRG